VRANKDDRYASRYRQIVQDEAFYEQSSITIDRLSKLEAVMIEKLKSIEVTL